MGFDWAIGQLEWTIGLLDPHLAEINQAIEKHGLTANEGSFDHAEFLIGTGFTGIQRYMTAVRSFPNFNPSDFKHSQLQCGPELFKGIYFAEALHAIANYWKHQDEWWHGPDYIEPEKRVKSLTKDTQYCVWRVFAAHKGLDILEASSEEIEAAFEGYHDYVCSNMLAVMVKDNPLVLSSLVPHILAWRDVLESTSQ